LQGPTDQVVALERVRWLDELIGAISEAQKLVWRLGVAEGDSTEARELYGRLESVRDELESIRLGDWVTVRKEIDPIWLDSLFESLGPFAEPRPNSSDALR
jgi:hypothetical protein